METSNARVQAVISYFNGIIECSTDRNEIAVAQMAKEAIMNHESFLLALSAVESIHWYTLKNGKMSEGASSRETAWYRASDVLNTLESIGECHNCVGCSHELSDRELEPCCTCVRNTDFVRDRYIGTVSDE